MVQGINEIRELALRRAGDRCEWANCGNKSWLELAHIQGIGMGGSKKLKLDINNVTILCKYHHDIYDGRSHRNTKKEYRELLRGYLNRYLLD